MTRITFEEVTFGYPEGEAPVFRDLTLELPSGVVSLIGQNGVGKSTLLLLAGGSVVPDEGRVSIDGVDTRELRDERKRQEYVSFIFQNMEFETQEPIGELLEFVYENGFHKRRDRGFPAKLIEVFELGSALGRKTQEVSKGELQRTILAFSLLYGSRILLMDEPIFALEPYQKTRAMQFLAAYARENSLAIYYSAHELDITEKYSDHLLVLYGDGRPPRIGPTAELFERNIIEQAYDVPMSMLKRKESLYREALAKARRF